MTDTKSSMLEVFLGKALMSVVEWLFFSAFQSEKSFQAKVVPWDAEWVTVDFLHTMFRSP